MNKLHNVICYKAKTPLVVNRGTKYEESFDTFLLCYHYGSDEQAQADIDRLNAEKPDSFRGVQIDWNKIEYLYRHKQGDIY